MSTTKSYPMVSEQIISSAFYASKNLYFIADSAPDESLYRQLRLQYEFERVAAALTEEITYIKEAPHSLAPHEYENVKRLCDVFVQLHQAAKRDQ